jgi:hypothetical protein
MTWAQFNEAYGKAALAASLRRVGTYEDLAAHGVNFHKRVICRSDTIVSRPPRKGMCHELKFS